VSLVCDLGCRLIAHSSKLKAPPTNFAILIFPPIFALQ
jgi:hypothetical protein